MLWEISRIAIPSILQQSFVSVGNLLIQGIINTFGAGIMAGYSAAIKLNSLVISSFTSIGNGISNFTSQNLGAGKPTRVRQGFFAGVRMICIIGIPLSIVYVLLSKQLVYLFLNDPTADALGAGISFLRIVAPFYLAVAVKLVADGILRGAGVMKQFMIATFADLILRVILAKILASTSLGSTGIWMAWPIGWCIAVCLSVVFCFRAMRQAEKFAADADAGDLPL
jgi:Na+-driven multidrug efflux pump